jgi:succinoglycan biosynthesis transport protein ExoP
MVSASASSRVNASFADFLSLLRRRLALIALIFAVVVLTTLGVTALLPKEYLGTTKIRVEKPDGEVKLFQSQAAAGYDPYYLQDQLKTLQSEKILYPVIESLGLNAKLGATLGSTVPLTSAQSFAYLLAKMLRVDPQRSSSVIYINVYARDGALAAAIANEVARVYSEDRIAFATAAQREGIAELKKQLAAQEDTVARQSDVVEKLRKDLNIQGIDLTARTIDLDVDALRVMKGQLIAMQIDADRRKTEYDSFKAIPRERRLSVVNSELIRDANILQLGQAYLLADQTVTRLRSSGLGDAHRDMVSAVDNRNKIAEQLGALLDGYEQSLLIAYRTAESGVATLTRQLETAGANQILSASDRMRPFNEATLKLEEDRKLLSTFKALLRQREIDFQQPKRTIEILNTAEASRQPSKPSWLLNSLFAVFFGGLLGVGVAVSLEYFDSSFRSVADAEARMGLPVLGVIPLADGPGGEFGDDPAELEPFRVLHTNLNLTLKPGQTASFAIFSAGPGEGKSTTLHRLARIMAESGERVLLIDSDLRRPTQHHLARRPRQPGLGDLLVGRADLDAVIQPGISPNLDFIPSGGQPGFTLGLMHGPRLKGLVAELRGRYDRVIFDSPPIIGVSDASILASAVDGALLLIQHRRNPAAMVERARQILVGLKTPVFGLILNQVPLNAGEDYGYYTSNYAYYSDGGAKRRRSRQGAKPAPGEPGDGDRLHLKE